MTGYGSQGRLPYPSGDRWQDWASLLLGVLDQELRAIPRDRIELDIELVGGDSYSNDAVYIHNFLSDINFDTGAAGGASAVVDANYQWWEFNTGGVSGDSATFAVIQGYTIPTFSWDKTRRLKFNTACAAESGTQEFEIGMGDTTQGGVQRRVSVHWTGGTLYGNCCDGTTCTTVSLGVFTSGTVEIVFVTGSKAEFYIDGTYKGKVTTNLPSGDTDAERLISGYSYNSATPTAAVILYMNEFKFLQSV